MLGVWLVCLSPFATTADDIAGPAVSFADAPSAIAITYNAWCLRTGPRISLPPAQTALIGYLRQHGIPPHNVLSPLLTPQDETCLSNALALHRIAARVTRGAHSPRETAAALFSFVTREILPHSPTPYLAERPLDVLIRGHASCDQAAWTFCALAEQCGIPSMIVYLRNPVTRISSHTIAALRIGDTWIPFDPYSGIAYTGTTADQDTDLFKAIENPGLLPALRADEPSLFIPDHLPWATFHPYASARGCLPRWSLLQQVTPDDPDKPVLWINPLYRMQQLRADMAHALDTPASQLNTVFRRISTERVDSEKAILENGPDIRPYDFAFTVEKAYTHPAFQNLLDKSLSHSAYRSGRLLHLQGRHSEAIVALQRRLTEFSTEEVDSESGQSNFPAFQLAAGHYFLALALNADGKAEAALNHAEDAIQSGIVPWSSQAGWLQAECLRKLGKPDKAAKALQNLPAPRDTTGRAFLQHHPAP